MPNYFSSLSGGGGALGLSPAQRSAAKKVYGFDLPTNYTTGESVKTRPQEGISVPTFSQTEQTLLLPKDFNAKIGDGSQFGGGSENDPNSMFSLLSKVKNPLLDSVNQHLTGQLQSNLAQNNADMAGIDALSQSVNRAGNLAQENKTVSNIFDPGGYASDVNAIAAKAKAANDITPFQQIIDQYKPNLQNYVAEENRYLGSIYDPNGVNSQLNGMQNDYKTALNRVAQQSANAARRTGNMAAVARGGGASSYLMAQDAANAAPIYANAAERFADRQRGDLTYLNNLRMGALGRRGEGDRLLRQDDTNLAELNRQFGIANAGIDQNSLANITGQRLGLLGRRNALTNDTIQGMALPASIRNSLLSAGQQNLSAATNIDNANRFYGLYKPDEGISIGGGAGFSSGGRGGSSFIQPQPYMGGMQSVPTGGESYNDPFATTWTDPATGQPYTSSWQNYQDGRGDGAMSPVDYYNSRMYSRKNYKPDQLDSYGLPLTNPNYE